VKRALPRRGSVCGVAWRGFGRREYKKQRNSAMYEQKPEPGGGVLQVSPVVETHRF